MTEKVQIPYNDVFFYGINYRPRETADVKNDIFANIMMRYLRTLGPVSNRLYRTADGNKYEYSYSFVPSQRFSWRVIKNRRIIEEIEYLSDGKYCLNLYDDQGKDKKRVIYDERHRWFKTNYYNSIYGDNLLCSMVPKELNGQTVILVYTTGATYPVTYNCLKKPSCAAVLSRVLERVPEPDISALTNYGILYFATEETANIYHQVLSEEENKYAEEHKPPVFTTDEDVKNGFCFDAESFNSSNSIVFNLSEAEELTEENATAIAEAVVSGISPSTEDTSDEEGYSIDEEISNAIDIIENATNLHIDEAIILGDDDSGNSDEAVNTSKDNEIIDLDAESYVDAENSISEIDKTYVEVETVSDTEASLQRIFETMIPQSLDKAPESAADAVAEVEEERAEISEGQLLSFDDDALDDYVRTLIDSLLENAKSAVNEYSKGANENFSSDNEQLSDNDKLIVGETELTDSEEKPDKLIENGDEKYYYFGSYDEETGRNGRGKTLMESGITAYEGEYLNDMRHGVGCFYYRSGDICYYGGWKENRRDGFGLGVSSDTGITHVGQWSDNKPQGVGVRFDKNGNFLYLDSKSENVNGGIRVTGFTDDSLTLEVWDEKTLKIIKKEILIDDLLK